MPHYKQIMVWKFHELSPRAKNTARNNYRESNLDYDWWSSVYEEAAEAATTLGITINIHSSQAQGCVPGIAFKGFGSQGDGAAFSGEYRAGVRRIESGDEELSSIDADLYKLTLPYILQGTSHQIAATISRSWRNRSPLGMSVQLLTNVDQDESAFESHDHLEKGLYDAFQRFARWIYKKLEAEHDYLNSDEVIDQTLIDYDNDYLENGNLQ